MDIIYNIKIKWKYVWGDKKKKICNKAQENLKQAVKILLFRRKVKKKNWNNNKSLER